MLFYQSSSLTLCSPFSLQIWWRSLNLVANFSFFLKEPVIIEQVTRLEQVRLGTTFGIADGAGRGFFIIWLAMLKARRSQCRKSSVVDSPKHFAAVPVLGSRVAGVPS